MIDDRELIKGTIEDIKQSLVGLRQQHAEIGNEIKAKEDRLVQWASRLNTIGEIVGDRPKAKKNPKGANLRAIAGLLATKVEGVAASQIRTETGLAWSSVQRTLDRNTDVFESVSGGLWRLRPEARAILGTGTTISETANGAVHVEE